MSRRIQRTFWGIVLAGLAAAFGLWLLAGFALIAVVTRPSSGDIPECREVGGVPVENAAFVSEDGCRLSAWLLRKNPDRCVVYASGFHDDRRHGMARAEFFLQRGYSVLLMDLRGTGRSERAAVTMGWRERLDLLAAHRYLVSQNYSVIGVDAVSLGAAAVAYTFRENPGWSFVILESCYDTLVHAFGNRLDRASVPRWLAATAYLFARMRMGASASEMRPAEWLRRCAVPALVMGGDAEPELRTAEIRAVYDACGSAVKAIHLFRDGRHQDFLSRYPDEYRSCVSAFLQRAEEDRAAFSCRACVLSEWMKRIPADRSLSELSIPGTHNSCARHEPWPGTAACQRLTIAEQLAIGVRFLDVRCRRVDNALAVYHGPVYQRLMFIDVIGLCAAFLKAHPSETILVSVKEEGEPLRSADSFETAFDAAVGKAAAAWFFENRVPCLGNARGKIVLLRRFGAVLPERGINATGWQNNALFALRYPSVSIYVQDCYYVSDVHQKWSQICRLYEAVATEKPGCLAVNFTSGFENFCGVPRITRVAREINQKLETYFSTHTEGVFGITVMDFATESLCRKIVTANDKTRKRYEKDFL